MLGNPGRRRSMDPCPGRPKAPSFLSDLGKATLRGIRRCPRCGTYNGTRGLSCKNKTCGAVFRAGARRQPGTDAVRLLGGARGQLYSVRQRDSRCFVELGTSETAIQTPEGTLLTQLSSGRCHAPACAKAAADKQCQHLKLALGCQAEATPLPLKSSVLGAVQAPAEAKQSLWALATEPTGPLVQRVTKSVLVVKCQASQRHGLGYLHASFGQRRFSCACRPPGHGRARRRQQQEEEEEEEEEEEAPPARCIHFLACICAFASDESLAQEFSEFLASDGSGLKGTVTPQLLRGPGSAPRARGAAAARAKRRKRDPGPAPQVPGPLLAPDPAHPSPRRSSLRKLPLVSSSPSSSSSSSLKRHGCHQVLDESQVSLSFQEWLGSVTERIHQTMHYQFEGRPEPLVFHIPQSFFEALQQRISSGSGKKRLPNSTTAFVRRDALPLGTFSKYTWHITNVLQVKQIFDTPEVPLEITRSFVQNRDGSYEPFRSPRVEVEPLPEGLGPHEKQPPLRPLELQTFLKVGPAPGPQCPQRRPAAPLQPRVPQGAGGAGARGQRGQGGDLRAGARTPSHRAPQGLAVPAHR
uniref:Putative treble-clef zinc-finger domain-containing protein n=1 Tax=Taeniopygia guttata TaxID=59729 RepID=A0A674GM16_TAEGU